MLRIFPTSAAALFLVLASAIRLHAYGPIGHQIIGAIADERLAKTPTGEIVHALLDGFTLEKASVIPDEIKGWDKNGADDPHIFHYSSRPRIDAQLREYWKANPPTKEPNSAVPSHHWFHYTDVPVLNPSKYADGKVGRTQWDIVHMISYCVAVLHGDEPEENARKITKPIAIILLAHFMGDMHQPLHVGAEYFDTQGRAVDPDKGGAGIEDQGGNTITLRHAPAAAARIGYPESKLHSFWDTDAVMANLPETPKEMEKEARKGVVDAARHELVLRFANEEPKHWRFTPDVQLKDYAEACANFELPIAREAHERLQFPNVRVQPVDGQPLAVGMAEEKATPDHVPYYDWAAAVVREEMHVAGWRLADLLERALK
ncbi:MAG: S1/P1 nuclease [Chthoniobacterales bacterium]